MVIPFLCGLSCEAAGKVASEAPSVIFMPSIKSISLNPNDEVAASNHNDVARLKAMHLGFAAQQSTCYCHVL
jgi:hypothetical protein